MEEPTSDLSSTPHSCSIESSISVNKTETNLTHCRYCKGISLDALIQKGGYKHATNRSSLVRTARKCKFCSLIFRKDRTRIQNEAFYLSLFTAIPEDDSESQVFLRVSHGTPETDEPEENDLIFFLFTIPGDPSERYGIVPKKTLTNTASSESFETAATWIKDCESNHICSRKLPLKDKEQDFQTWPARLLDLDAFNRDDQDIQLIDNDITTKKYACLSYCWGKRKNFVTTTQNICQHKDRIKFKSLPGTFRDAVTIARRLQIKWLWIDALCITQDDHADWEKESVKMCAIYSMSYFTIAADAGFDCNSGCFNHRSVSQDLTSDAAPFELRLRSDASVVYLWDPKRKSSKTNTPDIDSSPLSERGWVCQERILSPRILHYTKTQLYWECRQVLLAEDGLRPWSTWLQNRNDDTVCGLARNLYGSTTDEVGLAKLLGIFYSAISGSYSPRKLTLPQDKLTAISGIARAFGRHLRCKYLAGLWLLDLPWGLSWRRKGTAIIAPKYRAPSFSWAAFDSPVEWPVLSFDQTSKVEVLDYDIRLQGLDPFGRVEHCSLTLKGYVHSAMLTSHKSMNSKGVENTWQLRGSFGELGTAFLDDTSSDDTERTYETQYLILSHNNINKHIRVLLLKATDTENQYRREGVAEIQGFTIETNIFDDQSRRALVLL